MARRRASMREGPLAELFRATEAAQKQAEQRGETEQPPPEDAATAAPEAPAEPDERTVEHVPSWEETGVETPTPPTLRRTRSRDGRCPIRSRRPRLRIPIRCRRLPGPSFTRRTCRRSRATSSRCRSRPRGCTGRAPTRAPISR